MVRILVASPGIKLLLKTTAAAAALLAQRSVTAFYQTDCREDPPLPPPPPPPILGDGDGDAMASLIYGRSRQDDPRVYNDMIKVLAAAIPDRLEDLDGVLLEMVDRGYNIDFDAAIDLVTSYAGSGNVDRALWILGELRKAEVTLPDRVYRSVFKALDKAGRFREMFDMVEELIDEEKFMLEESAVDLLVKIYCKRRAVDRGVWFLEKVASRGLRASSKALALFVESLCRAGMGDAAVRIVDAMAKQVSAERNLLCCSIVCGVIRTGKFARAGWIVRELMQRGLVCSGDSSSEFSIPEAARAFSVEDFFQFFQIAMNLRPSSFEYNCFLQGFCCASSMEGVIRMFVFMRENGAPEDVYTYNFVVDAVVDSGRLDHANAILDALERTESCKADAITYTRMIDGFCRRRELDKALAIFSRMKDSKTSPDIVTFGCLINGFCKALRFDEAVVILNASIDAGLEPDEVTYSSFIDPLCNLELWDAALSVFELARLRKCPGSVYLYSRLMNCLCKSGKIEEAVRLLEDMGSGETNSGQVLGGEICKPTAVIYNSVIAALCGAGRINEALDVVNLMEKQEVHPDVMTYTSFLQAFCKSGMVDEACKLLEMMVRSSDCRPDTIACNALVAALCSADRVQEVCNLFQGMIEFGIRPDAFTFTWIIGALCRSRMVEAAVLLFEYMKVVECVPELETYREIVLGLYENGRVAQAKQLLEKEAKAFGFCNSGKSLVSELHGIVNADRKMKLRILIN